MIKYDIQKCTLKDIPYSLNKTVGFCLYTGICSQCKRMVNAVIDRKTIKIVRNNTITSTFYYKVLPYKTIEGITFTFTDYTDILITVHYMYDKYRFRHILILPHTDDVTFKSLVTKQSILEFKEYGTPLVIDSATEKFKTLLKRFDKVVNGKDCKRYF